MKLVNSSWLVVFMIYCFVSDIAIFDTLSEVTFFDFIALLLWLMLLGLIGLAALSKTEGKS